MRWWIWDVAIANKCTEVTFSFTGEGRAESIKGVESLKYLGRILYRSDANWQEVLKKSGRRDKFGGI